MSGPRSHFECVEDLEDPRHLIVVTEWTRRSADAVLADYADHENAKRANALVT